MKHRQLAALACATAASWALASGVASADSDPVLIGPAADGEGAPPAPASPFAAASEATKSNPIGVLSQLLGGNGLSTAGAMVGLTTPSPVDPLADGWKLFRVNNYRMPAGENPYVLESNVEPGPYARIDAFKGQHAFMHAGITGRMPGADLGAPLPGTAPLPGANVPAGLEQFYVPPAAPGDTPPPAPVFPPAG